MVYWIIASCRPQLAGRWATVGGCIRASSKGSFKVPESSGSCDTTGAGRPFNWDIDSGGLAGQESTQGDSVVASEKMLDADKHDCCCCCCVGMSDCWDHRRKLTVMACRSLSGVLWGLTLSILGLHGLDCSGELTQEHRN